MNDNQKRVRDWWDSLTKEEAWEWVRHNTQDYDICSRHGGPPYRQDDMIEVGPDVVCVDCATDEELKAEGLA